MVVYGHPDTGGPTRLGVSASRKVGGAVTRNRIRRRLSAAFRALVNVLPEGAKVIIVARPRIVELTYHNMETELKGLVGKLAEALAKGAK